MNEFLTAFKDEIGVGPEGIVKARVWQAQRMKIGVYKYTVNLTDLKLDYPNSFAVPWTLSHPSSSCWKIR